MRCRRGSAAWSRSCPFILVTVTIDAVRFLFVVNTLLGDGSGHGSLTLLSLALSDAVNGTVVLAPTMLHTFVEAQAQAGFLVLHSLTIALLFISLFD